MLTGLITVPERTQAFLAMCSYLQRQHFAKEFKILSALQTDESKKMASSSVSSMKKSKLHTLDPFFDHVSNVIRVGGRLRACAQLSFGKKHPIILPDCHFVRLYLREKHHALLHAGPTLPLATAREEIWIILLLLLGKNAARQVVQKCVVCTRWKGQTFDQEMGNLSPERLQGGRAFLHTGVDYAGPVTLKTRIGRGVPTVKGYIAVFVCFAVKAIHLEAISDLTSEAFIAAFRRFVARRGLPVKFYSDNGTNFVGAEKELSILLSQEQAQQQIINTAEAGIELHFIPPSASHMGGLWEAGVKSVKQHLRRVMKDQSLTYKELSTVLAYIESCLNSRPLCPLTEDSTELEALTPGHFLIGSSLKAVPDPSLLHLKEYHLSRWQTCQRLAQLFWKLFS